MKKIIFTFIFAIFLINIVFATSTVLTKNPSELTLNPGDSNSFEVSYSIIDIANIAGIKSVVVSGDFSSYSGGSINFNANTTTTGTITIDVNVPSNAGIGHYVDNIIIDEYILYLPIKIESSEPQTTSLISFPTSKRITVPQGDTYDRKITMIIPSNYPNPVNIQSIEFSEENNILTFGDVETGILNPGDVKDIPIKINAKDAQTGEYPSTSILVRLDDGGDIITLSTTLHIVVTANLNPSSNVTFSNKPSCSLSASVMNVNTSYALTCSGVQKNLIVSPLYNHFFEGLNAQINGDIYVYNFKPLNYGNTEFISTFTYLGAPLFSPFTQDVKISSSNVAPGTELKFKFTPELSKLGNGEEVLIQLLDSKTNNTINNPEVEVDAILLNLSGSSFKFKFESEKSYELRGRAVGYDDIIETINLNPQDINYTITPLSDFKSDTPIKIITDINATIFVDGIKQGEVYDGYLAKGEHNIELIHPNYRNTLFNISVEDAIILTGYLPNDFKKGQEQTFLLNTNVSWRVDYMEDVNSQITTISSGDNDKIIFTPDKKGIWFIFSDDKKLLEHNLKGRDWNKKLWIFPWWVWVLGIIVLIGAYSYKNNSSTSSEDSLMFNPNPNQAQ